MTSESGQAGTISLQKCHAITFALWNSNEMGWLDGGDAGLCGESDKNAIEKNTPNLKIGEINLTY
jgi:hypothetical protein